MTKKKRCIFIKEYEILLMLTFLLSLLMYRSCRVRIFQCRYSKKKYWKNSPLFITPYFYFIFGHYADSDKSGPFEHILLSNSNFCPFFGKGF